MEKELGKSVGERSYLFDNMKAILITLVVIGHLLTNVIEDHPIFYAIYIFIYIFHMPVFVFITGYFSKNIEKCREYAVEKYLIPYIVFCILLQVEKYILNIGVGAPMSFRILYPQWGMWYLIALFWWKFFLKDIIRVRFILPISLLAGLMTGFSREFSTYLGMGRTVCLLFFFLLGYYCKESYIEKIRKVPKFFGLTSVMITAIISCCMIAIGNFPRKAVYFRSSYTSGNEMSECIVRLLIYVLATLMIFAFINLMSDRETFYTYMGVNSVSVYLFHLFIIKLIERFYDFGLGNWKNGLLIGIGGVYITAILATPFFVKLYQKIMDLVYVIAFKKEK